MEERFKYIHFKSEFFYNLLILNPSNYIKLIKKLGDVAILGIRMISVTGKNNMVNDRISSFDAFLECKDLSINDLLEKLLHSNTIIQYEAAKRLQFFSIKRLLI